MEVRDLSSSQTGYNGNKEIPAEQKLIIYNKCDLVQGKQPIALDDGIVVSALTGFGIDSLRQAILDKAGFKNDEVSFTARARHIESMRIASKILKEAGSSLVNLNSLELLADYLRQAQEELGEILGTVSADELLGKIFSEFCIGK